MSVDQQHPDTVQSMPAELKVVEAGLKALWERARRTSEALHGLRKEKHDLLGKVEELELEVRRLQQEVAKKEQTLRSIGASGDDAAMKKAILFANGEREALAAKIKLLLAKLEAYL
jgi:predicted  nucleic acid-binding Zn-ribbon protein